VILCHDSGFVGFNDDEGWDKDDLTTSKTILLRITDDSSNRTVVLEDDGRVAYAYLLDGETVVGDVWLYNVNDTPDTVDWKDRSEMPFLNPRPLCKVESSPRLREDSAIHCVWSDTGTEIFIEETLMARLSAGSRPGWSRLALRAGPLAKPLEE
jgi:hypothetical protein